MHMLLRWSVPSLPSSLMECREDWYQRSYPVLSARDSSLLQSKLWYLRKSLLKSTIMISRIDLSSAVYAIFLALVLLWQWCGKVKE
nr:hypothetical protein Iba_chr06aCG7880 [Ipomoea batatas]